MRISCASCSGNSSRKRRWSRRLNKGRGKYCGRPQFNDPPGGRMTNDEIGMTKEARSTKHEQFLRVLIGISDFVIHSSFVIRHSSLLCLLCVAFGLLTSFRLMASDPGFVE